MMYPAYCITVHCSQGQSYNDSYTIREYTIAVEEETRFSYTGQGVLGGVITCAMCVRV